MKFELELKLQAYLDGELSAREIRSVDAMLEQDAEARTLLMELRNTRGALSGNEPEVALPESREFYWGKIQREILKQEQQPAVHRGWDILVAWRRYLAPIAGFALVMLLAIGTLRYTPSDYLAEVENLSENTGSLSFRSQSENMFVVWVYEKPQVTIDAEPVYDEEEWYQ